MTPLAQARVMFPNMPDDIFTEFLQPLIVEGTNRTFRRQENSGHLSQLLIRPWGSRFSTVIAALFSLGLIEIVQVDAWIGLSTRDDDITIGCCVQDADPQPPCSPRIK